MSTSRHLWELKGLLHSLFRLYETAMTIEVIFWPWQQGGTLEQQEPIAYAERSEELPGAIVWEKERVLKELEKDLEKQREQVH
jgi:hypothetical protein